MNVGIIGAMSVELERIMERIENAHTSEYAGMQLTSGIIGTTPVVVAFCKVGKVNAAICAQALISTFDVTHIINTGVAGSLDARINIGDLVVSTDAVHHDMDVANLGYALGQVPGMDALAFPTDEALGQLITQTAQRLYPEIAVYRGRVASGEQFVRNNEVKQHIAGEFGALCTEMEGAAIAHTCYLNKIPCVIVRAISDKADGSDAQDYPVFEERAAQRCAAITLAALEQLA